MTLLRLLTSVAVLGVFTLLGGCSTPTHYVVVPEDEAQPATVERRPVAAAPERYTVKAGDSLYLISFATGTDWRELARLNGITPPYRIYPGQSLLVREGTPVRGRHVASTAPLARTAPSPAPSAVIPLPQPAPASALPLPAPAVVSAPPPKTPPPSERGPGSPTAPQPQSTPVPKPAAAPAAQIAAATPPRPAPSTLKPPKPGAWQWPASGKLTGHFSGGAQPHKGIDLDGRAGDPVRAANSGVVVYAGSGVRGYGNLLIVKHDDVYLSAYAHNSKLLVKEGDVVRAGQTIAEIGDSGTDRVKLHFEVRRKGSPVDPLKVLPRR